MSYLNLVCCVACGIGRGDVPPIDVAHQTAKHGAYICKSCEEVFEAILQTPKDQKITINKGYGSPCETVITEDTIFYFDGPRVADPNRSFLGFGGAWILVIKSYPTKHGTRQKAIVTNNLWHSRRIPVPYRQRMKDAEKVDSKVVWADDELLADLRDSLVGISYIPSKEARDKRRKRLMELGVPDES